MKGATAVAGFLEEVDAGMMPMKRLNAICLSLGSLLAAFALSGPAVVAVHSQSIPPASSTLYVPDDVAERMLELAGVTKNDVVYDLGCGDGRIVIAAAKKYGAKAVGVDSDPDRIAQANKNAQKEGVSNLVQFVQQDTIDFSQATVVTMTVPQSALWFTHNGLIGELLKKQLKPGSRVVTNFLVGSMTDWKPTRVDRFADPSGNPRAILYLWKYSGAGKP